MSSPMDDVPVSGGMNTASGNSSSNSTGKKRDSQILGYINISIGGERVGSLAIETNPYNFKTNEVHTALVDLFSLNLTPEQLKQGVESLIQYGVEFNCQLASKVAEKPKPKVDFSSMFAGATKREIKS